MLCTLDSGPPLFLFLKKVVFQKCAYHTYLKNWSVKPSIKKICLSARTTTLEKILLFYHPFHAQEALESTLKLQNVSLE